MEVQNVVGSDESNRHEIVPLDPYDSVMVMNQAPFPQDKDNEPKKRVS